MKQYCKISLLLAVFGLIGIVFLTISTEAQFHITTVEDSAFSGKERMKPAVPFYHDEHNDAAGIYDCSTCHHMFGKTAKNLNIRTPSEWNARPAILPNRAPRKWT
jgi:hypothetical protein